MAITWAFKNGIPFGFQEIDRLDREWVLGTGWSFTRYYQGPVSKVDEFISTIGWGTKISVSRDGSVVTVAVTYESQSGDPNQDPTTDKLDPIFESWTLTANTIQAPLVALPKIGYRMLTANLAKVFAQVRAWQKKVDDTTDPTTLNLTTYTNGLLLTNPNNPNETTDGRILFEELVLERNEWEYIQPVIRHVIQANRTTVFKPSVTNVMRAFTWGRLQQVEPTLPNALVLDVAELETISANVDWKWQKRGPTLEWQSDGKCSMTQEYWAYEAFDTWRYGPILA